MNRAWPFKADPRFEPTPGKPTAAPSHFPFKHRNMAEAEIDRSYEAVIGRTCPRCHAAPGERCRTPGGRPYGIHSERRAG